MAKSEYFAIMRKSNGRLVAGSDRRYSPPHSYMADEVTPPLLVSAAHPDFIKTQILMRKINLKRYKIVKVRIDLTEEAPHGYFRRRKLKGGAK